MTTGKGAPTPQTKDDAPKAMDTDPLLDKGMPPHRLLNNITLRFQFPTSETATTNARGHISTMTTSIINKLLSFSDLSINIFDKEGNRVDRQSIIAIPDDVMQTKFSFTFREQARRQHEVLIPLSVHGSYQEIKNLIIDWLVEHNIWMIHHVFSHTITRTLRIGYIFHLDPGSIFRDLFQKDINKQLALEFETLDEPTKKQLFGDHPMFGTDPEYVPKIQVSYKPNLKHPHDPNPNNPLETKCMAIDC